MMKFACVLVAVLTLFVSSVAAQNVKYHTIVQITDATGVAKGNDKMSILSVCGYATEEYSEWWKGERFISKKLPSTGQRVGDPRKGGGRHSDSITCDFYLKENKAYKMCHGIHTQARGVAPRGGKAYATLACSEETGKEYSVKVAMVQFK